MVATKVHPVLVPWTGEANEWAGLNPQQQIAVESLLADPEFNMTEACRKAGYKNPTASANKLFKLPLVRKLIGRRVVQIVEGLNLSPERLNLELARIGFCDPRKMLGPDGTLLCLKDMDADSAAAISSIKVTRKVIPAKDEDGEDEVEQTTEVRFWDKPKALELLAKVLGMLKDAQPINNNTLILGGDFWDGLAARVQAASEDTVEKRLAQAKVESITRSTEDEQVVEEK